MGWIVLIIVLAVLFGILGAVIKGLLWLLVIGVVLFLIGVGVGAVRSRGGTRTR